MVRTLLLLLSLFLAAVPLTAEDIPLSTAGSTVSRWPARSASGAGLDLVVWEERSGERTVLKAKRIAPAGAPLDAEGIVVADDRLLAPYPSAIAEFAVAFDGEAFVVAWRREEGEKDSLVVRTISPAAVLSEPRVIVTWESLYNIRIAGGGEGRSAITWGGIETPSSPRGFRLVALAGDSTGTPVEAAPMYFSSATGIAATERGYLAVFISPLPCRITCVPMGPLYARSFGFDGTPTSEPRLLDAGDGDGAEILTNGESLFVAWGASVLRVDDEVNVVTESKLARGGTASLDGDEIRVDTGNIRAVYSPGGYLLRFEPLMLQNGESYAGAISGKRFLVVTGPESARRLVIRSHESAPEADLAVVATGALLPADRSYDRLVVFRIEHRGGAPVSRIALWWSRGWTVTVPGETTWLGGTVLDRPLRAGESFEIAVPINEWFITDDLWIAGDVVDGIPWNNADGYRRPERSRGRIVAR